MTRRRGRRVGSRHPAALQSSTQAAIQLRSSDGECRSATVSDIKKQEAEFFEAK
jgi:hypothetical protein